MSLHKRFLTARSQAKGRASGFLPEESLTQILSDNGISFQISGARVYPVGDCFQEVHVKIWIRSVDTEEENEAFEEYSALINASDMNQEVAARHGVRMAKQLFLECKLGVNVGETMNSLSPYTLNMQNSETMTQINQLAAATI